MDFEDEEASRRAAIAAALGGSRSSSPPSAAYHSIPAARKRSADIAQHPASNKILFEASPAELKAISLQRSQLVFSDDKDSLLGSGGFSEVFRGIYKAEPVAIKRLKAEARNIQLLSEQEIARDIESLTREALMMKHCSTHCNIIHVFGCTTKYDRVERPLIVMELMHTTLFDAVHGGTRDLSYAHLLYLLKGVAGALEFLHLQGIVHHDVKSVSSGCKKCFQDCINKHRVMVPLVSKLVPPIIFSSTSCSTKTFPWPSSQTLARPRSKD